MNRPNPRIAFALSSLVLCAAWTALPSSDSPTRSGATPERVRVMRAAAIAFLDTLSEESREQATFAMDDPERQAWSNLPHTSFRREGMRFGAMHDAQRRAAHRLLQSVLSSQGYLKVTGVMHTDQILADLSGRSSMFGQEFYWLGIFGNPREDVAWGFQLDGHHLGLNITVVGDRVCVQPTFLGSDPHEVPSGRYAGYRVLGQEDDLGKAFFASLDAEQRQQAVLSDEGVRDVLAGPKRAGRIGAKQGLPAAKLRPEQGLMLRALVHEYVHNVEDDIAHEHLHRLDEKGFDERHFAWMGTREGAPYYYRIHGPTIWIEFDNSYAPGRSDGPVNHIHSIWRDPSNDYGVDWLAEHYRTSPHHRDR